MNAADYDSLADAIADVVDGGTVSMSAGMVVDSVTSISKSVKIKANGATFSAPVLVSGGDVEINGAKLVGSAATTAAKNNAPVVTVTGSGDFSLTDCSVSGTTRTGISLGTSGEITVSGNTFSVDPQKSIYNAIEFSIGDTAADITRATVKNNTFSGTFGNNLISLYNVSDGAEVSIVGNNFDNISVSNNCVRLSNPKNNTAVFNIVDNKYSFSSETATDYTAFMLLQDYAAAGAKQDFSKFAIHFKNLTRSNNKITAKGEGLDKAYYVYDDQDGVLADGVNDPVVDFA